MASPGGRQIPPSRRARAAGWPAQTRAADGLGVVIQMT